MTRTPLDAIRSRSVLATVVVTLLLLSGCSSVRAKLTGRPGDPRPENGTDQAAPLEAGRSNPVADPLYPEFGNPALDVLRYQLKLHWSPSGRQLRATATLTIRAVTSVNELRLDFTDVLTVDTATVDGQPRVATRAGNNLVVPATVAAGQQVSLVVRYHGQPAPVAMPSGRTDFPEGVGLRATPDGEAWTMQEPYGAMTWYPANDHPSDEATYDVSVTVPDGWAGIAHGRLVGVDDGPDEDTYHWRSDEPAATYVATLAIGRYTRLDDTGPGGLPVTYWIRTGKDEWLVPALRRVPAVLTWLVDRFGPYPFPTAGVVVVDSVSAMETQQMVTYGARLMRAQADRLDTAEQILMHEFAHQWFGDAVTPTDWRGMWLNEGFAMYAEWLWTVDRNRRTEGYWRTWALDADRRSRGSAGPPGNPRADSFGEVNVYAGPAYLFHTIHRTIGDTAFFAMARDWVASRRNRQVDRAEFVAFLNQHTGRDFTDLVNRWLDSPTTPEALAQRTP